MKPKKQLLNLMQETTVMIQILIIFVILTSYNSYSQINNSITRFGSQKELYNSLQKSVDNKWIKNNPVFVKTKASFFKKEDEKKYFIGLLNISGRSIPFMWDDNLSLLKYLLTLDSKINIKQGVEADKNYKGTLIKWHKKINALIWFNNITYKAQVDNWYLSDLTDCPETIIFPSLSFKKVKEVPNSLTNNIQGLAIFPYNKNIKNIKSSERTLLTVNGKEIIGIGYDINNDKIIDIFSFYENVSETSGYTRLYVNINGEWICKWISLYEDCI